MVGQFDLKVPCPGLPETRKSVKAAATSRGNRCCVQAGTPERHGSAKQHSEDRTHHTRHRGQARQLHAAPSCADVRWASDRVSRDDIVIPESPRDEADTQVYGMLVNGRGEPWMNENGERILVPALPLMLRGEESADMPLTYKEVAKRAGISTSGVKRAVKAGELPAPHGIGERSVRFELSVVKGWIEEQRRKKRRAA